jgi:hypothetical protein
VRVLFFILLGSLAFSWADEANPPQVKSNESPKPLREFFGEAGAEVVKGPTRGVIIDGVEYEKIWRELGLTQEPGFVDFAKEVVVVSTTRGSRITFRLREEGEGRLQVMSISTKDIRPGLRFAFCVLSRSVWRQINDSKM